jgi:hypothetical protein
MGKQREVGPVGPRAETRPALVTNPQMETASHD